MSVRIPSIAARGRPPWPFHRTRAGGEEGDMNVPTGTVEVVRAPRIPPRPPAGELLVEPPPEPERMVPLSVFARLLPAVMLFGSVGFVAVLGPGNPSSWLFGGMFAVSTLGMLMTGGGSRGGGNRTAGIDEDRRDYLRYLALLRRRVRRIAAEQRAVLEHLHPDPAAWPEVLAAGRLWERRPSDPDFGQLRIGCGAQWLATRLVAPHTGPVEGIEPVTALALRRFLRGHAVVPGLPVALSLLEQLHRVAGVDRAGDGPGGGPGAGQGRRRAVHAAAQPGRRPARGDRPADAGGGVGVGQVVAAQRPSEPARPDRSAADGRRGCRRACVAGGRPSSPGARRVPARRSRICSSSSTV